MRLVGTLIPQGALAVQAYPSVPINENEGPPNIEFEITSFSTAPTFKCQGTNDPVGVTDANADWYDMDLNPSVGAVASTHSPAAAGVFEYAVAPDEALPVRIRLNVSVTGSCSGNAEVYQ